MYHEFKKESKKRAINQSEKKNYISYICHPDPNYIFLIT